jgi:hypothetical protein
LAAVEPVGHSLPANKETEKSGTDQTVPLIFQMQETVALSKSADEDLRSNRRVIYDREAERPCEPCRFEPDRSLVRNPSVNGNPGCTI